MSRIGKKPILIPENVDVKIIDNLVVVKGPKGELSYKIRDEVRVIIEEDSGEISGEISGENSKQKIKNIIVSVNKDKIKNSRFEPKAFWGLTRSLIFNMIQGVLKGYEKKLELVGVGYKVAAQGKGLKINVGYSHPVFVPETEGITFNIEKNIITIFGIDKKAVGQVAANIRKIRKPEPYKGKGIRYVGEVIKLKAGKKTTK